METTITTASNIQEYTLQYGVLGILAFLLGYFAWMQYQRIIKKNDDLEKKIDKLQDEMMLLLIEERDRLADLIKENTQALSDLQKTIFKYLVSNNKDS